MLRRLRLPHMRRIAGEVLATAKVQRWEPAEVLRALLAEEVAGRERSALATRRRVPSFPPGNPFQDGDPTCTANPQPTLNALLSLESIRRRE
ncbi:MAG: ATP-binding protein, partial [Chloroflexota bacterium]